MPSGPSSGPSRRLRPLVAFWGLLLLVPACETGVRTPIGDIYWTQFQQQRQAAREEAAARYRYCPEGGCIIRLESVQVEPGAPRRGEALTVTTSYTLLTAEEVPIPVTISRELWEGSRSLGKIKEITTSNPNGTWSQRVEFPLPEVLKPGTYTLVTRIHTPYGFDSKNTPFTVK